VDTVEFNLLRVHFLKTHGLPFDFDYAGYLKECLHHEIMEMLEITSDVAVHGAMTTNDLKAALANVVRGASNASCYYGCGCRYKLETCLRCLLLAPPSQPLERPVPPCPCAVHHTADIHPQLSANLQKYCYQLSVKNNNLFLFLLIMST
jgi:hypothetical protein